MVQEALIDLLAHEDGHPEDDARHGDSRDEGDAQRSAHESAQLPQQLLLPRPRLLAPERATRGTEIVKLSNLWKKYE